MAAAPASTWHAPGRVTLIGDHTDYSEGYVLPLAIGLGTTVSLTSRSTGRFTARSGRLPDQPVDVALDALDDVPHRWARYVAGAVLLLRRTGVCLDGVDVVVDGDLPLGSGLSSSASLVCATLGALLDVTGVQWDRQQIALAAQRVENEFVGAPVGAMDPTVVMHARTDHALLVDTRTLELEQVPLPLGAARAPEGCSLLVVDTHEVHSTSGADYAERVAQCGAAAHALGIRSLRDADLDDVAVIEEQVLRQRARHVVTENRRVLDAAALLRAHRLREVGRLLTESHVSLRDDFGVSTRALDLVVESALDAGALGARVTGAGFGGSAVVLTPTSRASHVTEAVQESLVSQGIPAPTVRPVTASAGASPVP